MNPKNVGNFIAELRREKNITQKDLADRLGVTDKAVSRWETGKGYPDIEILQNISTVLGVTVNELLCGERLGSEELVTAGEKNVTEAWYKNKRLKLFLKIALCAVIALCIMLSALAIYSHKAKNEPRFLNVETYLYSTFAEGIISECAGIINSQADDFEVKNFSVTVSGNLEISQMLFDGISRKRNTFIEGEAANRNLTSKSFNCKISETDIPSDMSYLKDEKWDLSLFDIYSLMSVIDFKGYGPQECDILFSLIPDTLTLESYTGGALSYPEYVLSNGKLTLLSSDIPLSGRYVKFDISRMLEETEENEITVNGKKTVQTVSGWRSNTYAVIYVKV